MFILFLSNAHSIHICVTYMHTKDKVADDFIRDVKTKVAELMLNPSKPVEGKVYIMSIKIN